LTVGNAKLDPNGDASISFTSPGEGKDSYAVDIGGLYKVKATDYWFIAPTIKYNRNSEIQKEQDVFQGGVKGSYRFGDPITDNNSPSLAVVMDGRLDYKRDSVKDTESWTPYVTFMPLYYPWGLASSIPIMDNQARIRFNLLGGFGDENAVSGHDGNTLRATVKTSADVYPLYKQFGTNFILHISNQYWNKLTASGKFDDGKDDFNMFKVNTTYYFHNDTDKNDRFGVKLEYWNGADPDNNLEDQSAVTFGFVFSL